MLQKGVMVVYSQANRRQEGAGLQQLQLIPMVDKVQTPSFKTVPCCELELWLFKAQPIGRQGGGASTITARPYWPEKVPSRVSVLKLKSRCYAKLCQSYMWEKSVIAKCDSCCMRLVDRGGGASTIPACPYWQKKGPSRVSVLKLKSRC